MNSANETDLIQISQSYSDLIDGFMQRRFDDVKAMEIFYKEENFQAIVKLGHTLEGASYTFGFNKLGGIARSLKLAGERKNLVGIRHLIDATVLHLNSLQIVYF